MDTGSWTHVVKGSVLTVLQVVAHEYQSSHDLYWIGLDSSGRADVVQLVGGASYAGCGRTLEPASLVSIEKIADPFSAQVRLQPATESGVDGESLTWVSNGEEQNVTDCIRSDKSRGRTAYFTEL